MFINKNFLALQNNYLFTEIERKVNEFKLKNPDKSVIKLGIGDVSRPIPQIIVDEIKKAADEMADIKTFKGYGPETGYDFLKATIIENEYQNLNIDVSEIFISDGIASDIGNILDLFSQNNSVAICDPVYPEYLDTNIMDGRKIFFMPCTAENDFIPQLPDEKIDLIYICNPNNPTGTALNKSELQKIVDYAFENNSVILYDGAYEKFICSNDIPHSIFELDNAKKCAIEFRSFSKSSGFTGLRCGYTIVPNDLVCKDISLNKLWNRRQSTKTNGVSYIIQRAAQAVYLPQAKKECAANIKYYMDNAKIIYNGLKETGYEVYGGNDAPYIWLKISDKYSCWQWFDMWLEKIGVVGTPGIGFGKSGEKYFRLSAFGNKENTSEAIDRIKKFSV